MCHYIHLVLPENADADRLRAVLEQHHRALRPATLHAVLEALGRDERAYETATWQCDCGTALANPRRARTEQREERELARLRERGWSEAKIARWREQRAQDDSRKAAEREGRRVPEAEEWRAIVDGLLDAGAGSVGLLVHLDGNVVRRGPVLPRASLDADGLKTLDEDVITVFTRAG